MNSFAAKDLTMGQLNALVKKMGGKRNVERLLRDELVVSNPHARELPVWKTIKVGGRELDLVVVKVKELGFKNRAVYLDICAASLEFGLTYCPSEAGPALRSEWAGRSMPVESDYWLLILGQRPSASGYTDIYILEDVPKSLKKQVVNNDRDEFSPEGCFIFVKSRK